MGAIGMLEFAQRDCVIHTLRMNIDSLEWEDGFWDAL